MNRTRNNFCDVLQLCLAISSGIDRLYNVSSAKCNEKATVSVCMQKVALLLVQLLHHLPMKHLEHTKTLRLRIDVIADPLPLRYANDEMDFHRICNFLANQKDVLEVSPFEWFSLYLSVTVSTHIRNTCSSGALCCTGRNCTNQIANIR